MLGIEKVIRLQRIRYDLWKNCTAVVCRRLSFVVDMLDFREISTKTTGEGECSARKGVAPRTPNQWPLAA
jgi:hypothetical protein